MYRQMSLLIVLFLSSTVVYAHHPLAGMPMSTFAQGLLSGIGHPVIGIDHLFFVIAVGIVAFYSRSALSSPVFYLVGMLLGISLVVVGIHIAYVEVVIALSLVLLGAIIVSGRSMSVVQIGSLLVFLGVFHGYAFGESVVGVESVNGFVWAGYLIGLCVIQWLIAISSGYLGSKAWTILESTAVRPRLMGAVTLGVGITFFVEVAETLLLQTI